MDNPSNSCSSNSWRPNISKYVFRNQNLRVVIMTIKKGENTEKKFYGCPLWPTALVLSPSTLQKISGKLKENVFPKSSYTILETLSNLGLLYAMFIEGLHADLTPISHKRYKSTCVGCLAFVFPFIIGCGLYIYFGGFMIDDKTHNKAVVALYWGIIIASTSFQTVTPILANLEIFCTNIGQEALSMSLLHDVFTSVSVLLTLAISTSTSPEKEGSDMINSGCTWWAIACSVIYMMFCWIVIKPIITKISNHVSKAGESYINDVTLLIVMFFALTCGFLGNYIGSHFIFAAFVLGTSVPSGVIAEALIQKLEGCILGVLMPLYFANMGTKIDVDKLIASFMSSPTILIGVIAKALCTLSVASITDFSITDAFALGLLLSAKGLLPLVLLNIGHDRGHLAKDSFETLLLIIMFSTCLVAPLTSACYRRTRKFKYLHINKRMLEGGSPDEELRIVTCIQAPQNVYSIINLLEISSITSRPCMSILALHMIELLGHAPPMLVEHEPHNSYFDVDVKPFFRRTTYKSFQIIEAFHEYEDMKGTLGTSQLFTMVSPADIIDENICNFAETRLASLIILASHMQQGIECSLEDANTDFRVVYQRIMCAPPCSVALFIDRGLSVPSLTSATSIHSKHSNKNNNDNSDVGTHISMIYIGGADDREALTYASRMARHPFVTLKVVRFVVREITMEYEPAAAVGNCGSRGEGNDVFEIWKQIEREKQIDEEFLNVFRRRNKRIDYVEKLANTGSEAISILREMHQECNLYITGRCQSKISPLVADLDVWSEYKELGPVADILVTSDFSTSSSILVIQQYKKHYSSHTN